MVDRDYSLDTDVVELTRKFNTFVMNNKRRSGNVWGSGKVVKFQYMKFVDESGRHTSVCPLCYEEGHKRKDCPENVVDYIRRCFKCNRVLDISKLIVQVGSSKATLLNLWKVSNGFHLHWEAQQRGVSDARRRDTLKLIVRRVKAQNSKMF